MKLTCRNGCEANKKSRVNLYEFKKTHFEVVCKFKKHVL